MLSCGELGVRSYSSVDVEMDRGELVGIESRGVGRSSRKDGGGVWVQARLHDF